MVAYRIFFQNAKSLNKPNRRWEMPQKGEKSKTKSNFKNSSDGNKGNTSGNNNNNSKKQKIEFYKGNNKISPKKLEQYCKESHKCFKIRQARSHTYHKYLTKNQSNKDKFQATQVFFKLVKVRKVLLYVMHGEKLRITMLLFFLILALLINLFCTTWPLS